MPFETGRWEARTASVPFEMGRWEARTASVPFEMGRWVARTPSVPFRDGSSFGLLIEDLPFGLFLLTHAPPANAGCTLAGYM